MRAKILTRSQREIYLRLQSGHDSFVVFAIDQSIGWLTFVEHAASGGKTPRNYAFVPSAQWIVLTNKTAATPSSSASIQPPATSPAPGDPVSVPSPFCERFLPIQ